MGINNQVDLSIIIVNWNVKDYLRECLISVIEKTKGITSEIIVVDNASVDGSVEMVRREFPRVRLVENSENVGFGRANNLAVPFTKGKYIGLLNPDTILVNDAFSLLVAHLEKDLTIGIVGPKLLAGDGTIQGMSARKFNNFLDWLKLSLFGRRSLKPMHIHGDQSEYEMDRQVDCVSGACMVVRRDIIQKEQIFDPIFFMYGEDVDLCYTTVRLGWRVFYLSKAIVIHYGGESSKQEANIVQYDMDAVHNLAIKRYGKLAGYVFKIVNLAIWLLKLLFTDLILLMPSIRQDQDWLNRRLAYKKIIHNAIQMN
jgi:GT2 family glycosyltransferase